MDIARPDLSQKSKRKKWVVTVSSFGLFTGLILFFVLYQPSAYEVEKESIFIALVSKGELLQQVHGIGQFESNEIRWISAQTSGRIERIHVLPGAQVDVDTVILELSNPELIQKQRSAALQVKTDHANFLVKKSKLQSSLLASQSALARIQAEYKQAKLNADIDQKLFEQGLESKQTSQRSDLQQEQLSLQLQIEKKRFDFAENAIVSEVLAEETNLEQNIERLALLNQEVDALSVKAGFKGLLQKQNLNEGQRISVGADLAQVVNPHNMKATIQISEHQAKNVTLGLKALVDTRSEVLLGRVERIDPNVESGTVTVDIEILDDIPLMAKPDSTIEGMIEISKIENAIHVSRPVFAKENGVNTLYKLSQNSDVAQQIDVQFGRSSIDKIEVLDGLAPGDKIIISDTSDFFEHKTIKIN